jgi:hypothetical protein
MRLHPRLLFFTFAGLFLPAVAFAQPTTFAEFVELIIVLINVAIPLLFGSVFVYFIWKMIDCWILNAGDQAKREAGRRYAVAAVVVFVVMVSAWGIVAIIRDGLFGI